MKAIIERFEMARVCKALREKGWQLVSGYGNGTIVELKFAKIRKINPYTATNIVDILEYMYGY